jgi:hypothetical protein
MLAHQQRYLASLQSSPGRFEDVTPAELRLEQIRDPHRHLPALEIPIGSSATLFENVALDAPGLDGLMIIPRVGPPPWIRYPHRHARRQVAS